jgi:hypothetical protein
MAFKLTGNGWPKPRLHPKDPRAHDGVKRESLLPIVGTCKGIKMSVGARWWTCRPNGREFGLYSHAQLRPGKQAICMLKRIYMCNCSLLLLLAKVTDMLEFAQ